MSEIVILGAGGHAKVIADILLACGHTVKGFVDDRVTGTVLGLPVLGRLEDAPRFSSCRFVIGIGDNAVRESLAARFDLPWHTAIHPTAVVCREAEVGEGSVIMAQAVIGPSARVGRHAIVNTAAVAEHDCAVEDFAHISPRAVLCGGVRVGRRAHIGAGAVVLPGIRLCADAVAGAGAVVTANVDTPCVVAGVPARMLRPRHV
ncbi:acetyltransferase [Mailhella sp.]|uniref:acetyltransferase n=1 Tax=Mailhella sp. TaxID=1981029 RepID=UPI004063608D